MDCAYCSEEVQEGWGHCPACGTRLPGFGEKQEFQYEAFISYRHVPRDRSLAKRIQRTVEGFRVPGRLQGGGAQARLRKCFRDEDELPTVGSLPDTIERALSSSRYLIVVCSPEMRESVWCAKEVERFAQVRGRDKILLALSKGEPVDAFPLMLQTIKRKGADGLVRDEESEPVAADFREGQGKRYADEVLRIVSSLIGCNYDDLKQRMRARRNKRVVAIASAVAVVSVAFAGFSLYQQSQIQQNLMTSLLRQSELQAQQSQQTYWEGKRTQAIRIALEAIGAGESGQNRPYASQARLALEEAVDPYPSSSGFDILYANEEEGAVSETVVSADGTRYAVADESGNLNVYDVADGRPLFSFDPRDAGIERQSALALHLVASGDTLYFNKGGVLVAMSFQDGAVVWSGKSTGSLSSSVKDLVPLQGGATLAACFQSRKEWEVVILDARTGAVAQRLSGILDEASSTDFDTRFVADPSQDAIFLQCKGSLVRIGLDGSVRETTVDWREGCVSAALMAHGGTVAFAGCYKGETVAQAFDAASLAEKWCYADEDAYSTTMRYLGVFKVDNVVESFAIGMGDGIIYLDVSSGEILRREYCSGMPIAIANVSDDASGNNSGRRYLATSACRLSLANASSGSWGSGLEDWYYLELDAKAEKASFFAGPDGAAYALLELCRGGNDRYTVMARCQEPDSQGDYEETPETSISALPKTRSCDGTYLANTGKPSGQGEYVVEVADGETFRSLRVIPVSALGFLASVAPEIAFSSRDDDVLYLWGYDSSDNSKKRIVSINVRTGSVLGERVATSFNGICPISGMIQIGSDGTLYLLEKETRSSRQTVLVLDATALEVLSAHDLWRDESGESTGQSSSIFYTNGFSNGTMIFLGYGEGVDSPCVVDPLTGRVTGSGPDYTSMVQLCAGVGKDGTTYLLDQEGRVCCYKSTGGLSWRTDAPGSITALACLPDGNLVVQDLCGAFSLVDGKTGNELARDVHTTDTGSFGNNLVWWDEGNGRLYVKTGSNVLGINGKAESFGVESRLSSSAVVSRSGSKVRVSRYVTRLYTTDELIALAKKECEDHPLTRNERLLYGVSD